MKKWSLTRDIKLLEKLDILNPNQIRKLKTLIENSETTKKGHIKIEDFYSFRPDPTLDILENEALVEKKLADYFESEYNNPKRGINTLRTSVEDIIKLLKQLKERKHRHGGSKRKKLTKESSKKSGLRGFRKWQKSKGERIQI